MNTVQESMTKIVEDGVPFREILNTWVQTAAIVLAGIWAVYSFVHKEILIPSSRPAFISADVDIARGGVTDSLEAIQLKFTVSNQGEREIFTLPSIAVVWGTRLQHNDLPGPAFIDSVNSALEGDAYESRLVLRHATVEPPELVGIFRLFSGYEFLPKSSSANEVLIYVPRGRYDQLEVKVNFPVVSDTTGIDARWVMRPEGAEIRLFKNVNGKSYRMDGSKREDEELVNKRGFGIIDSYTVFSLWKQPGTEGK